MREWIAAIAYESFWTDAALAILEGEFELAWTARRRAAERLVADGRRAEADVQFDKALAFYRSVGATRYIRDGEALLAVSA